ncbi:glycosyltransferase [Consotaella aegiceratis]|uniref:glycosyltransferase n=1 Tax=Consotaella aegiceratis TaxID=3097961 RepID=UPI002F3E75DD
MKIIQLMFSAGRGGTEVFYARLGRALHERGHPQHMIMGPHPDRERYFSDHGVPYTTLNFSHPWKFFSLWRLRKIVERERPDALVAWKVRAARNAPTGSHLLIGRVGLFYDIKQFSRCDLIVANSPELTEHAHGAGRSDARFIANFAEISNEPAADRSAVPGCLLFTSARLTEQKGLDTLIRALPSVDATLWIAGSGDPTALRALAAEVGVADRVEFLGWRNDVSALLKAADIFVLPSRREGTSNALLEAAAAGKPIVTTSGASVSWFLQDRVNARVVPVDDVPALASAIGEVATDPTLAARLGEGARARYLESFSEDAICSQWLDLIEEMAERKKKGQTQA